MNEHYQCTSCNFVGDWYDFSDAVTNVLSCPICDSEEFGLTDKPATPEEA